MENPTEAPETPHKTPEGEGTPENPEEESEEKVELSKSELEALKHRAEVSSQNFERLKKAEQKLKEAEERLKDLSTDPFDSGEEESDLRNEVKSLRDKISGIERNEELRLLETKYPVLKEKKDDFTEFLEKEGNETLTLTHAATLFLAERDLLGGAEKPRKGLERPTGGERSKVISGYSAKDVENMRKNDYPSYIRAIREGKLDPKNIK